MYSRSLAAEHRVAISRVTARRDTVAVTTGIEKVFARARLRHGDILLPIRDTVGRVYLVPAELQEANITQDTARPSIQAAINPSFVVWFLRAATTQKRMQKAVKGVAVRGINIGDVRALQLPVPPISEQGEPAATRKEPVR